MTDGSHEPSDGAAGTSKPGGLIHRVSRIPTPLIFAASVAIALGLLWREGSLSDVGGALRKADPLTIVAGLLLYLAGLALLCLRWDQLVRMVKGVSNLPRASEAFLTSVVINYAAPIGLAVPSRAALTKRALGLNAAETGAVALWEVAVDVLILAGFSLVWLLLGGRDADILPETSGTERLLVVLAVLAGVAIATTAALLIAHRKPGLWLKMTTMSKSIATFPAKRPIDAALSVAITAIYWAGQAAVIWLLLRALDVDPSVTLALGLTSLPILVGMLSPVPGGAGIREALMLAVARAHNADSAAVLLAALTYRIALFASIPVLYAAVRLWLNINHQQAATFASSNDATQS
ncbi:MAG: flippase-like domain-containing protein [Thermomicrobiales bacterium]|nr:flippase-like domain-containing protein [Thermomicrobiales bacterium]